MHNPFVPETLEGWSVLHLMYRIDWARLGQASPGDRRQMAGEFATALASASARADSPASPAETSPAEGATALVQLLGHKGDLMVIVFRHSFDGLGRTQLAISRTNLHAYLTATSSYVSIVELGMYDMTAKIHRQLTDRGLVPGSADYEAAFDEAMERQRERVAGRLFTPIPPSRFVCFYPMDKRRGELHNWYTIEFGKRAEMMLEHGKVGREYAGKVTQIISGSIGFDDWEWGVDLFADDPLIFKKLIYEMRFDEASAKYAEFGPFYTGLQFSTGELGKFLEGEPPQLSEDR
ncbi:MAG TPA: hydrogen peroxide-dependent heme synthase [Vicinamibacterales bacterium]|nr:hydrogen peroxide-dependent heme synthase [Vicinamibacterales bacterium]